MRAPDISVIMATYNHASFVKEAMESVLSQQGVNIEFIIADDGSTDTTREVIAAIADPRISYFPSEVNRGACIVTNELIARSRGKYIALINSDDSWIPGKLRYQFDYMETNPSVGLSFGRARFMDRDGVLISKEALSFGTVFDQDNRTAGRWLRRFFSDGNCICHPTMLIRREVYEKVGLYSNHLRQLPDLDMWIRIIKEYDLHISDRELINYRILPGENASSQTSGNAIRTINEHYLIAETVFDGVSRERMIEGFDDILVIKNIPSDVHLEIEKTLLYFHSNQWLWRPYKMVGLPRMRRLLSSVSHRKVLSEDYGIDDHWFHDEMSKMDVLLPPRMRPDSVRHHTMGVLRAVWRRISGTRPAY